MDNSRPENFKPILIGEKKIQWLALYFKTSARKKIQSWSTVVEISHSRSLFEALKSLLFEKYVSLVGLLKYNSFGVATTVGKHGQIGCEFRREQNPEIPESWLSKHSPGYFKSQFYKKKQID